MDEATVICIPNRWVWRSSRYQCNRECGRCKHTAAGVQTQCHRDQSKKSCGRDHVDVGSSWKLDMNKWQGGSATWPRKSFNSISFCCQAVGQAVTTPRWCDWHSPVSRATSNKGQPHSLGILAWDVCGALRCALSVANDMEATRNKSV